MAVADMDRVLENGKFEDIKIVEVVLHTVLDLEKRKING